MIKEVDKVIESKLIIRDFSSDFKEEVLKSYIINITKDLWDITETSNNSFKAKEEQVLKPANDICTMCNKYSALSKIKCQHPRCSSCLERTCSICAIELNSSLPSRSNSYATFSSCKYNSSNTDSEKFLYPKIENMSKTIDMNYETKNSNSSIKNNKPIEAKFTYKSNYEDAQIFNPHHICVDYSQTKNKPSTNRRNTKK